MQAQTVKARLIAQQEKLKGDLFVLAKRVRSGGGPSLESNVTPTPEDEGMSKAPECRVCPMCEAFFLSDVSQEAFEAHVLSHFHTEDGEEGETLRHYDMMSDAEEVIESPFE